MIAHEPPLFGLLKDNPYAQEALKSAEWKDKGSLDLIAGGHIEKAAEEFVEKLAMGAGEWEKLPQEIQKKFIYNAITWYDEMQDPQSLQIDITALSDFKKPALLSSGSESPPFFPLVIDKLMNAIVHAKRTTIEGAGHVPHMSHSEKYIELLKSFCL